MELKSITYLLYALLVVLLYFAAAKRQKLQEAVVLCANIIFIWITCGLFPLAIILVLTGSVFLIGQVLEKNIKEKKKARIILWCGLGLVIGVLCYFKFFKSTYELLTDIASMKGITLKALITPVGLSYYSLTLCAYLLDISHKKHKAETSFFHFFTFITYFPAIIQGPIGLYKKVAPQFSEAHFPQQDRIVKGLMRILWGYFKKVVIADRIGILVIGILKDEASAGFLIFWAMVLYSFQIYTDFSGGIDVVMGIAEIMDIKLIENFKAPLISKSITEYWQRWHMSLGEFMEKYIYYPIVLNRNVMKFSKKIKNSYMQKVFSATMASVIVFVIVGIWHGTGWNYVVYGCYQALFTASAVLLGPVYKSVKAKLSVNEKAVSWQLFQILRTFFLLCIGRYFIRAKDLTQAFELFRKTFGSLSRASLAHMFDGTLLNFGLDYKNMTLMYLCILLVILVDIFHDKGVHFRDLLMKQDIVFRYLVYFAALFAIIIFGVYGPGFSGASFIYQTF